MTSLEDISVTQLKGVGNALAGTLAKLGIHSVQDLLFHLPHRYEDRTRVIPMGSLRIGDVAVVEGEVMNRKSTRLNSSHVRISYAVFCLKKKKTTFSCQHFPTQY